MDKQVSNLTDSSCHLAISVLQDIFVRLSKIDKQMFVVFLPDVFSEDKTISDTAMSTIMRTITPYTRKEKND